MNTMNFYRHPLSGHAHRVELLLSLLGIETNVIDIDLLAGEHKQAPFLRKNPFGQVPVLEDGDITIADSNAILVYLATKYDPKRHWLPVDAAQAAEVQRFLSLAAGPVAYGPAAARLVTVFGAGLDHQQAIETAHAFLPILNQRLQDREWLATDHATIADLANYTYIAHAPEGNVAIDDYPAVRAWLKRVESLPGFTAMQATAAGLVS